jgi:uncharacterized protein
VFEWDEGKRATNLIKHGIDFTRAIEVFDDARRVERTDARRHYGEERRQCIGLVQSHLLFVVYAVRGDVRRLISARKASKSERKAYDENSDRTRR